MADLLVDPVGDSRAIRPERLADRAQIRDVVAAFASDMTLLGAVIHRVRLTTSGEPGTETRSRHPPSI